MKIKKLSVEKLWNKHTFTIDFNDDITILIGKNGSGKSTILNLIDYLLSNGKSNKAYKFSSINLSFDEKSEIKVEQQSFSVENKIEQLDSIKMLLDKIREDISLKGKFEEKNELEKKLFLEENDFSDKEIDYLFLNTFDMEVQQSHRVLTNSNTQKHYKGKSYIKTELDVLLNSLITDFKLYLLKIKKEVELIQDEFDKQLNRYTEENNINGLKEKLLEKSEKLKNIYQNRDTFENKINQLFLDTGKKITLDENNSIIFELEDEDNDLLTPFQLSSGEKQILIIMLNIMLLDNKPTILLMDEPEISLHVEWQRVFIETLLELNPNLQIIIATHSPAIVSKNFRSKVVSLSNFHVKG
jgi:ABC-type lipoprotein export system ATPase subunit